MKMSDIKVGMRLTNKLPGALSPITVTEIKDKGFKYRLDSELPFMPEQQFAAEGHEHYGYLGNTDYELEPQKSDVTEDAITAAKSTLSMARSVWLPIVGKYFNVTFTEAEYEALLNHL